jgi:hypothetical protein
MKFREICLIRSARGSLNADCSEGTQHFSATSWALLFGGCTFSFSTFFLPPEREKASQEKPSKSIVSKLQKLEYHFS